MYEDLRNQFVVELEKMGIELELANKVLTSLDLVASNYTIKAREANLVPYVDVNKNMLGYFLACRGVEGMSKQSLTSYGYIIQNFLDSVKKHVGDITTLDIRSYLYHYQQERAISDRSLEAIRVVIASFFRWLYEEEYIAKNPCAKVKPIKYEYKERGFLSQLQVEYLRKACITLREKVLVEVLYSTGCRISELTNLKLTDVDMENKTIQVLGKGKKQRTCFLNAKAYIALKEYFEFRGQDGCEYAIASDRKYNGIRKPLTRSASERLIQKISARSIELGRVTPHVIRHTTATTALRNGMPVQEVSMLLGHARLETTMIYAKVNPMSLQEDHKRYVI